MKGIICTFLLLLILTNKVCCQCTFASDLQGHWHSNAFGTVTITTDQMTLGSHSFTINGKSSSLWDCIFDLVTPYVILRSAETFPNILGEQSFGYICMVPTQVNTNSFYFYMNSAPNPQKDNERIEIYALTSPPGNLATAICTTTPSSAEFISLVKVGLEADAVTDCPDPLHRNFTYTLTTDSVPNACSSNSFLSVCPGRTELEFNYTICTTRIAYSADGILGCVASIDDGSGTLYASLYNFDKTVNTFNTFRFTCAAIEDTSSGTVRVSYLKNRCTASQNFTTGPTEGGLLTLTPNGTCEITTTTEEITTTEMYSSTEEETTTVTTESPIPVLSTKGVNIGAIIGGVLAAMIFILLLLLLVIYCIHRKKVIAKQRAIIDRRLKLFKIRQAQGLDDDEKCLAEPSLDPDFPSYWEPPKQELLHPIEKHITKDMMSQTERAQKKKIIPEPIPEPGPTPKYLPWPWRTAKRASKKSVFESQTDLRKFGPLPETTVDCVNLADYTVSKYGLRYDDTGVEDAKTGISRPPTRFIPSHNGLSDGKLSRSKSVLNLSRARSRVSLSRSSSLASLNRSRTVLYSPNTPRRVQLTRSSSVRSLKSLTERTHTNILMSIQEKKNNAPKIPIMKDEPAERPVPHYMFPIRTQSVASKFDKEKYQNPLAVPLRRAYTMLRPIPTKEKTQKSILEKIKKKKKKVLKKKKSPYISPMKEKKSPYIGPTKVQQIKLLPLSLQKTSDNKVRPVNTKKTHKPEKTEEQIFQNPSPSTKSPKTTESNFTMQSPDTMLSTDLPNSSTENSASPPTDVENKQNTTTVKDGVEFIKADKSAYQDSGISAGESSPENPSYDQHAREDDVPLSIDPSSNGPRTSTPQNTSANERLQLPRLELDKKPKTSTLDKQTREELKLPMLKSLSHKKSRDRPWK